jgi:uncharacterized protein YdgA (DUF945 family)
MLGGLTRERYFRVVEEAGGGVLSLGNESYEQGIFTSRAVTMIRAAKTRPSAQGDAANQEPGLLVRHTFYHGPLTFSGRLGGIRAGLALVESAVETVPGDSPKPGFTVAGETPALTASLFFGFGNDMECALNTAAFSYDANGMVLAVGDCAGRVIHDPETQSWRGEMALPRYTLSDGDFSFTVTDISMDFDMAQFLPWVFVGKSEAAMSSMNMTRSGQSIFTAEGLRSSAQSSIDAGLLTSGIVMNLQNATAGGYSFGPVFCDMEIRDMNATTISESYIDLTAIVANRDVRDIKVELAQWNQRLAERLMAEGVKFDMRRLSVPTSMGALECSVLLALQGSGENNSNPLALLGNLNATAQISVDESLVVGVLRTILRARGLIPAANDAGSDTEDDLARQMVSQNVEPMVAQGLLRREGGTLKADAVFEKGSLLVNNRPVPLL